MKITATETMTRIAIMIRECEYELTRLASFSDEDHRNEPLNKHIADVKKDLENASARMSSAIMATRLSK